MALLSFSAGLSGLNAHGTYMSVIGNNLANINTTGFKSSSVAFQDLVSQTLGGASANSMQVGLGVTTAAISPVFSQGTIESTREGTNVAVQGNGLFIVADPSTGAFTYTRAGAFSFDRDGRLVTPDSQAVQGYTGVDPVTGAIIPTGPLTDIVITPGVLRPPVATTSFTSETNLDANTAVGGTFNSTLQIFDSLGAPHMATITFTRQAAAGTWNYQVSVPGAEIVGGTAGTPFSVATGSVAFGPTGVLTSVNGGAPADVTVNTPAWTNGAAASAWSWNLVDPDGSFTLSGYATTSATSSIRQNGSAPGSMNSIAISPDGVITATFGAGEAIPIAQLATATFNNLKGLVKLGSNRYAESSASGNPSVGVPGTGGRGTVIGSALELSNVDIAHEFTQMILAQRGYQANSKTITVSDELLVDTLNLKR
jgi:flagellar hook protein FlgE